jgi:uncharacterized damage-inducible protein DinB
MYPSRFAEYLRFANNRMLDSMEAAPDLHPRAWEIAAHLLEAEAIWLDRLTGRDPTRQIWPSAVANKHLRDLVEANALAYEQYLHNLGPSNPTIEYTNSKGETFQNLLSDILAHVFSHGAYHRGQIASLVAKGAGQPAHTDYIVMVRKAP